MEDFLNQIISSKQIREHPEVKRIFRLHGFIEQAEKESKVFEIVMT